jgi:D-3-phosphoglycerate dehydrogenase
LHNLVVHAATDEEFWQLPRHFEEALAQALPEGWSLSVCRDAQDLPKLVKTARVVIGWPYSPAMARRAPELRWVHLWTAGVPEAFRELASDRLRITSAAGINASSVAEHALFLVLAGLRGVRAASFAAQEFAPERFAVARPPHELDALVIGHGHVGQRVERLLQPLFRQVRVVSRTAREAQDDAPAVGGFDRLADALSMSDVVVLALPLTRESRAALHTPSFYASLKKQVCLVNVARGELVDEACLLAYLSAHPDSSYLTDVTQPEPYPRDGLLWSSPQVVITPHVAGRRADLWGRHEEHTLRLLHTHLPALGEPA